MKKNTLALNIGEKALIEGFGIVRCIKINIKYDTSPCLQCCMYGKHGGCMSGELVNIDSLGYCIGEYRNKKGLDNCEEGVIFTRVTAVVKLKNIKL